MTFITYFYLKMIPTFVSPLESVFIPYFFTLTHPFPMYFASYDKLLEDPPIMGLGCYNFLFKDSLTLSQTTTEENLFIER